LSYVKGVDKPVLVAPAGTSVPKIFQTPTPLQAAHTDPEPGLNVGAADKLFISFV
jgi:hypothetical protein